MYKQQSKYNIVLDYSAEFGLMFDLVNVYFKFNYTNNQTDLQQIVKLDYHIKHVQTVARFGPIGFV